MAPPTGTAIVEKIRGSATFSLLKHLARCNRSGSYEIKALPEFVLGETGLGGGGVFVARSFFNGLLLVVGLMPAASLGCERGADSAKALLIAKQSDWERAVVTLQRQEDALRGRFDRLRASRSADLGVAVAARIKAILNGSRQSLVDVESEIRQVGPRFDQGIAGGGAPDRVAEQEGARIDADLQTMSQQLAGEGQELNSLERAATERASR